MTDYRPLSSVKTPKNRFYYGYIIIAAAFLILLISWGVQYSFGVFFKPVLTEFGWTRAATSGAYSLNMVLTGVIYIVAGKISDRFGPRLVITFGGLLMGLGYLLMSQVSAIWQIYLFYGVLVSIGLGCMFVPLMSTVARWFVKSRSLASGIIASGIGIGIIVMPLLANYLIGSFNWRVSYIILGITALVLIVIIAQFLRRPPGHSTPVGSEAAVNNLPAPGVQSRGFSLTEALHTRQFWIIIVISLFCFFGVQTVMVHIVAHSTDIGISDVIAAAVLSVVGFISTGSKVFMGSLGDKFGNRQIMVLVFALLSLSFLWLIWSGELWMLYLFAVIFGLGYGGFVTAQSPLVADCFGLKSHGIIFGLAGFAANIGGALGSLAAGRIFDAAGSYLWAFILCAALSLAGLVLSALMRPVRQVKPERSENGKSVF